MNQVACNNCHQDFEIFPEDREMLERLFRHGAGGSASSDGGKVPEPTWCPECRIKRRNVWRVERKLYKRACDLCKKSFIFVYPEGTPFPVYCRDCWLSDQWSATTYGIDYDFNKPFFQQWRELFLVVPRVGIIKQGLSVNSEYTNRITDARNCYLVYATTGVEDCRYGAFLNKSKDCLDCYSVFNSERCSECIDCERCYNIHYSQESQECRDSKFLFNCRNLSDSFGCVNMRNGRYLMFNEQLTKEEYERRLGEISLEDGAKKLKELREKAIVPGMVTYLSPGSTGNWLENAKRATYCFNMKNVEEMRYCQNVFDAKDCMDYSQWGNGSEQVYETVSCGIQCGRVKFINESWSQLMDSEYCTNCHQSSYLFGCDGIRSGKYMILNKHYTQEEYEALVPKIKAHMDAMPYIDAKGRAYTYGEFFPEEFSPFPYNESVSQELFPMTKEAALAEGHIWHDQEERNYEIKDDVIACAHGGTCEQLCTSAFRILPEDKVFYERHGVPAPIFCPNCRHFERLAKRNPLKLWSRACAKCAKAIETSYSPDRPETVYCIDCYQAEIV